MYNTSLSCKVYNSVQENLFTGILDFFGAMKSLNDVKKDSRGEKDPHLMKSIFIVMGRGYYNEKVINKPIRLQVSLDLTLN